MFEEKRDYISEPLLLKRYIDGKYITLNVILPSYNPQTKWVLLFDRTNQDFYEATFDDSQFKNIKRLPYTFKNQ